MSYRCQTCPNAFCEDCLPPGEIDAIGDTLPELYVHTIDSLCLVFILNSAHSLIRGYGETHGAYYIRCHHCKDRFEADPASWESWQEEFRENEANLEKLRSAGKL